MQASKKIIFPQTENTGCIDYCSQALNNTKGITLASLNICSITRKYEVIKILLEKSRIDLLALIESFLYRSIEDSELTIEGYRIFRHDRTSASGKNHGGGIIVYSSEERDIKPIDNGAFCTPNRETLWLEMKLPNSRPTVICSIYRPPDATVEEGLAELQNQFDSLEISHRSDIIFLGDLNVELIKPSTNKTRLTNSMKNRKLDQLINKATRVTVTTSTLIDHIWSNNPLLYSHTGLLDTSVSDHALMFCCRKRRKISRAKRTIEIRSRRNFNPSEFEKDVTNTDWSEV